MHYSEIILSELQTYEACDEACDRIWNDGVNLKPNTGYTSDLQLLASAQKKVEAIQRRGEKLETKRCEKDIDYAFQTLDEEDFQEMHGASQVRKLPRR
jgi:hypothetical protein